MTGEEESIAGFGLAEEAEKASFEAVRDTVGAPLVPRFWTFAAAICAGLCLYLASADVLLLFWGRNATGIFLHCSANTALGCNNADYLFKAHGKAYRATVNYWCNLRTGCVAVRTKVAVNYVSWDPAINKAHYNPYTPAP